MSILQIKHPRITPSMLGSHDFRCDYSIKYAYVAGSMYKEIASKDLVIAMGRAGLIGYLGTGGLEVEDIEASIRFIQQELRGHEAYGMNLLSNIDYPELEERTVDLFLKYGIRNVEAAAFMQMTPALVRYRVKGIALDADGRVKPRSRILAKVSRPEVAELFMRPAPAQALQKLLERNLISRREAELGACIPMCDDICVEADSGGHTDGGVAYALMPAMMRLRDKMMAEYRYAENIRAIGIGAAGGIGTPHAAAAALIMGAEFILTGSINQCTVEAGISDAAKDILQDIDVQDTAHVPAGDMFELGAKVQVVKKGLFFPARATRLYELYQRYDSIDEIDATMQKQIQEKYFKRSFAEVWEETKAYYQNISPAKIAEIERYPKKKMALIFKWYFVHTARLALEGRPEQKVDYQIHCGPALGAFNQCVKGTRLESWRNRRVADIAEFIMQGAAGIISRYMQELSARCEES